MGLRAVTGVFGIHLTLFLPPHLGFNLTDHFCFPSLPVVSLTAGEWLETIMSELTVRRSGRLLFWHWAPDNARLPPVTVMCCSPLPGPASAVLLSSLAVTGRLGWVDLAVQGLFLKGWSERRLVPAQPALNTPFGERPCPFTVRRPRRQSQQVVIRVHTTR